MPAPPITIVFALRSLCTPTGFVLSMHKMRAFIRRSMRLHCVHWWSNCVATAMLAFPRSAGWHSGFFRTPPWCDSSFTWVVIYSLLLWNELRSQLLWSFITKSFIMVYIKMRTSSIFFILNVLYFLARMDLSLDWLIIGFMRVASLVILV